MFQAVTEKREAMRSRKRQDNSVELKELVYAPLGAVADANIRLSSSIVDFLANTGDVNTDSTGSAMVRLRTIQMMYEQLRSDSMDNTVAESIGLEIPLLSIFPLSALKVSKTKVSFGAEIINMKETKDGLSVFTQISPNNNRAGANNPRISYEVEMDSAPISEGLARFIDTLNTQAIPKRLHSKPVDSSGKKLTGRELEEYQRLIALKERETNLNAKADDLRESIRIQNNALEIETGMNFDEYKENLSHLQERGDDVQILESYTRIEEYQEHVTNTESQLNEVRQEILRCRIAENDDTCCP
jgi:hypothetical protein